MITIPGLQLVDWISFLQPQDYLQTISLMEQKVEEVIKGISKETIFLLEHKEIITAGSSHKSEELLNPSSLPIAYTGRGGKFTFHNEGQRVIYPILNLKKKGRQADLKLYIFMLEDWVINTLKNFGIKGYRALGRVGVWVNIKGSEKKIAAIGIRVRKWVTYHGIAININNNLEGFNFIVPCGLANYGVTSFQELGVKSSLEEVDFILKQEFIKIFG